MIIKGYARKEIPTRKYDLTKWKRIPMRFTFIQFQTLEINSFSFGQNK